jgi:predicted metal-dependent phosphotriesterase family hydrolase
MGEAVNRVKGMLERRDVLRLMGAAGVTIGAGAGLDRFIGPAFGAQAPGAPARIQVPTGGIIRTIRGDLDPNTIGGATLMHEHVGTGRAPGARSGAPPPEPNPTTDREWMAQELTIAHDKAGLGMLVAANTGIPGPDNAEYLTFLSQRSNVHLVAAAAYYLRANYPAGTDTIAEDELVELLVRGAASARLGAFGELGVTNNEADIDPVERKVFRAFGRAQARTNLPIFTHNNYSTGENVPMDMAVRQLDALEAGGANPKSIALGHVCCLFDPMVDVHKKVARRGAFIAFDRVTRQQQWVSDEKRIVMLKALLDAGLEQNILLSSDYIGRVNTGVGEINGYPGPLHGREGGPGYARPLVLFVPQLLKAGIPADVVRRITQDNPRRFLTFVPKNG